MQKWEYKIMYRMRGWTSVEGKGYYEGTSFEIYEFDLGNYSLLQIALSEYLQQLGEQGWELVSVVTTSDYCGGISEITGYIDHDIVGRSVGSTMGETTDFAGMTTSEKWIFKRNKE